MLMFRNNKVVLVVFVLVCVIFTTVQAGTGVQKRGNLLDLLNKIRGSNSDLPQKGANGHGKFTVPLQTSPYWSSQAQELSIWGVNLGDLTNDGYPEVITIYEQGYNYIYSNNHGVIETTASWVSDDWGYNISAALGDYDNDGDLDMAVASYSFAGGRTKVYRNDSGTLTKDPVWVAQSGGGTWCDWGDFDNDGDLDLAITDIFANPAVFRNNNGILEDNPCWYGSDYNLDFGGTWIDVDNDGDLDLMVGGLNFQVPLIRIYKNDNGTLETSASWVSQMMAETHTGIGLSVADIDRDGWLDAGVASGFTSYENNVAFKNLQDSLESNPSWSSDDALASGFSLFGELNGDNYVDWVVNNGDCGSVYENNSGILNSSYTWSSSVTGGLGIDLGDVDQDGIRYREDTLTAPGNKKLFYLSKLPIEKIVGITINGNPVPLSDYCCNLKSGWVSFKNSIGQGIRIIFKYNYSIDLELLLSDYNANAAHLFRNTTVSVAEQNHHPLETGFKVFPNPVRSGTALELTYSLRQASPIGVELYDCSGKRVMKCPKRIAAPGNNKENIAVDLPQGVYFIRLNLDKKLVQKIIVVAR